MKTILLMFVLIKCFECASRLDSLVMTKKGPIRGLRADNGDYNKYLGIPYAVIDESNRFGNALPHPGFDTIFEAYSDDVICPQYANGEAIGNINCLNLNIYVPDSASPTNKLPVMFYLPGGAFKVGNGNERNLGPRYLLKHDVIIVTANYRLGPYGFLCLDIPGYNNQGLKDQMLALNWVVDNIGSFGGDADRITAFGQSAGAMSLDLHLYIKKPAFKRVIMQSGVAISPWVMGEINNTVPIHLAKYFGSEFEDVAAAMDYLKTLNVSDVIMANQLSMQQFRVHPVSRPCIENANEEALLTDHPTNLNTNVKDIEIMIGHAFREASFLYPDSDKSFYDNYEFGEELLEGFVEVADDDPLRHLYIGDEKPSFDMRHEILDFGSDFAFVNPVERSVKKYLDNNAKKVFWYIFTYEGGRNRNHMRLNLTSDGATHGDDLGYLWDIEILTEEPTGTDKIMLESMTKMWTDFAKYGDPTPFKPTELIPLKWREVKGDQRPYLRIDYPLKMENRPFRERMAFWDMYYKLHEDIIRGIKK